MTDQELEGRQVTPVPGSADRLTGKNTHEKGDEGEDAAVEYLLERGYAIVTRKYRSHRGEIDCVVRDPKGDLVFVEVKSASSLRYGHPFSWITQAKQRTIARVAQQYLAEHDISSCPCRFDCIAVVRGKIEHLRNAFLAR